MRNKRKTKFKFSKCFNSHKSTLKIKHMNTRRMQSGGSKKPRARIHAHTKTRSIHGGTKPPALRGIGFAVNLGGDRLPRDGAVYQASSVTPDYIYIGQVKHTARPRSMTCGSDSRLPCRESMMYSLNGIGRMVFLNEDGVDKIYNGQWRNDYMTGRGTMKFSNGDIYEGDFVVDKMSGHGKLTYKNGDVYDGNWANDRPNGIGTYTYDVSQVLPGHYDRAKYVGHFLDGKFHGQGRMEYTHGEVYEGEWANDNMNGLGQKWFYDGSTYEGNFVNGIIHGQGTMIFKNKTAYEGIWENPTKGKGIHYSNYFTHDIEYIDTEWNLSV
uniref:MORN repeat-containing protein n=1 Tax=viral metagenome TaxID=1070528 RepID=A0A6C0I6S1_9ZZZZ